ncbi:hypothetical protein [Gracilinema caldarium]|uniref:hypothetical protein n=1 Tax=Gracilinema caldarium TaxID=215591 RepID=UPI0026EC0C10|nr:hypothetical protein [Gracilinema caldarium]
MHSYIRSRCGLLWLTIALFLVFCTQSLFAIDGALVPPAADVSFPRKSEPPFPALYLTESIQASIAREQAMPYSVPSYEESIRLQRSVTDYQSILLNNDILAFYGSPLSKRMGILGVYPIDELHTRLMQLGQEYDALNGNRGLKLAFYIIYGTVWPEGEIGILRDSVLKQYLDYALQNDILVFLDHQIGRYGVVDSLKKILPYLRYPNVHLALDPEWRTTMPMKEIGSVNADEINQAQEAMEAYMIAHDIPGERMLVVHQFNWKMIQKREQVRTDFARVRLIHCADGFGAPAVKKASYDFNALAKNMPVKAFKLFFKSGVPGAGFDEPLLSPAQVLNLDPRPYMIMYQ